MIRVVIPQIFENMEEATIGKWLVAPGDTVEVGTPLCELITEKTTLDLTAEAAGTVRRLVVPDKSIVPVGFIIAVVGAPYEAIPDVDAENAAIREAKSESPDATAAEAGLTVPSLSLTVPVPSPSAGGTRVRATPAARRAAKDAGVDIEAVAAAFPGKVIGEDDVRNFVAK